MTDDKMRQLEAVAQAVLDGRENVGELYDHLGPRDVLALIQRVRDAEAAADSAMGDMSADLMSAEQRGAEWMRDEAVRYLKDLGEARASVRMASMSIPGEAK